jgi:sec-independent protein translocase protein TatA
MFAFFNLGATEVIVLVVIGLLLFGKRLPDLARSVGKTFVSFKKEVTNLEDDLRDTLR